MQCCQKCGGGLMFWVFYENLYQCLSCPGTLKTASVVLLEALGNGWEVIFAENEKQEKLYMLRKGEVFVGTLNAYYSGIVYFTGSNVDEQAEANILTLLKALPALNVFTMLNGRDLIVFNSES